MGGFLGGIAIYGRVYADVTVLLNELMLWKREIDKCSKILSEDSRFVDEVDVRFGL